MAWTEPVTRATGDLITAAIWNEQIVENLKLLGNGGHARVYNSANISVAASTETALTFNSERSDADEMHDTSSNTSRLTAKTAGIYAIGGGAVWSGSATGYRSLRLRVNGATQIAAQEAPSIGSTSMEQSVHTVFGLAANDYVELVAYQTSGGNLSVLALGTHSPEFYATLLNVT